MIEILTGDMLAGGAGSLVCPSNCLGALGAGLAKHFKRRYPEACAKYTAACRAAVCGGPRPGNVLPFLADSSGLFPDEPLIYFAMTKGSWRHDSQIEWIRGCAANLLSRGLANASTRGSMAVPALGCGEGGLDWNDVRPILIDMAEQLERAGVKVFLYGPQSTKRRNTS